MAPSVISTRRGVRSARWVEGGVGRLRYHGPALAAFPSFCAAAMQLTFPEKSLRPAHPERLRRLARRPGGVRPALASSASRLQGEALPTWGRKHQVFPILDQAVAPIVKLCRIVPPDHGHDLATGLDAVPAPGLLEHARGLGKDSQQSCLGVPGHRSAGARAQGTSFPCSACP